VGGTACVAGQGLDGEAVGREEDWMNIMNELSRRYIFGICILRDEADDGQSYDKRLVVAQLRAVIHDAVLH
jgi:hypothetical protein